MINVISAVFRGAQSTTTRNAYQYDYGQVLKTNLALPETYEVQFSNNSSGGVAITQIGNADGVTIPDQMFISGAPIYAWIFLHQGADDGETVYFITIPVTKRAKPTSKQPTPVQKDAINQAIAALNAAVEQTGQDVTDAAASASAALASGRAAQAAQQAIENMAVSSTTLSAGSDATVTKTEHGGVVNLSFGIPQGDKGDAAGFGTVSATVDANTGTPSVEVTTSGPDTAKNIGFAFHNLKGDTGATPNFTIGTVQTLLPTQDATATITGMAEAPVLNLGIPKGYSGDATNLAADYSSNKTYTVGEYCIYNGSLYRCTTAITTAEAWTAAHWTQVALGDDVSNLKSAITSLDSEYHSHIVDCINLFNPDDPDLVENVELTTNGATTAKTGYFASGYYPVIPGGTVCLHYPTGTYGSSSKIYLYNADKSYRDVAISNVSRLTDSNGHTYIKYTFSASTQAKWFRVTGYMAAESYYMYVYAAEMPSTYVPYTTNKTLDNTYVDFSMVKNVEISKNKTNFISDTPVNLVDLSALVPGIISNSSSNGDIDTSGTYGTNWVTTDYIPVEPGETYALCIFPGNNYGSGFLGIPYYDANKNFLGRVTQSGGSVGAIANRVTITIPSRTDIRYIRTSYYKSYTDSTGSDHKRWWQCQIFHASAWPTDMYVPYDGSDKIVATRLDDTYSAKYNPLWGKTAMWNGDSICAADSDTGAGWPGRIASANGMKYKNYGIAGGTIAENTRESVHSVSGTLDSMLTAFPNADYVVIEGGTNDADILGDNGIGTFSETDFSDAYITALDKNTFSGALESIFYRLVTQMKTKHIGYLIPQKMGHTEVLVTRRRTYFDRAIAICQKWGIPYLDLWNDFYFNWRLSAHWDQTMTNAQNEAAGNLYLDGQHLTTTGYAVESPVIAEWMKTL